MGSAFLPIGKKSSFSRSIGRQHPSFPSLTWTAWSTGPVIRHPLLAQVARILYFAIVTAKDYLKKLSATLFWDVDTASVDASLHKRFLICRVMDRGTLQDVRLTRAFYSSDEIRDALVSARVLHPKTIAYFAVLFDLPREAFRAYKGKDQGDWKA